MRKLIAITIALLPFTACTTGMLDVMPQDRYTDENFWTTEKNASAALSGCYQVLTRQGLYDGGNATILLEETATPNAYNYTNRMGYGVIALGTQTNTNASIFNARWFECYRGIGRCNTLLARIDGVKMNDGLRQRMKAEAQFLRALYYSTLAIYFNRVPLILDPPDAASQSQLPRNSHQEIVAQVLKDLDEAAAVLPYRYTGDDIGRATKGAALSLKARVLLFEASPLLNSGNADAPGGDIQKWKQAADAAKAVIDLKAETGYGLYPDYRQLFLAAQENSQECVFDVQFKVPEQGSSFDVLCRQWNDNAPLQDLAFAYDMKDGLPASRSPLFNAARPYENRDPRMSQTIVCPGDTYMGNVTTLTTPFKVTGFGVKKYSIYDREANTNIINEGRSDINYMVIRYADVLLMYAEAQNEVLPAPDNSVYEAVNAVRRRAGMPDIPAGGTKEQLRELIRRERRVEFACEGLYYNDIRRWKTAEKLMNATIYNAAGQPILTRTFDPGRDYWWLIPQQQLELNPNLDK